MIGPFRHVTIGHGLSDRQLLQRSRSASSRPGRPGLTFFALVAVAVSVELVCAWLSYHTIGEIASTLVYLGVGLNVVAVLLYVAGKQGLAVVAALAIFLAIAPYQTVLGYRLMALQGESGGIVSYLYDARLRTGEYPADLSGYRFQDAGLQPYFHEYYRNAENGGFTLSWYVGTPATSHSYTPLRGWGYYAD